MNLLFIMRFCSADFPKMNLSNRNFFLCDIRHVIFSGRSANIPVEHALGVPNIEIREV